MSNLHSTSVARQRSVKGVFILILVYILVAIYIIASILEMIFFKPSNFFSIYFGVPGSGKTTMAAYLAKKELKKRRKVYSNVDIKGCYAIEKSDIGHFDISNGLLILDEAGIDYNNRESKKFTHEEVEFFKKHRHYNVDVAIFSQDYEDMDKKLRKLATKYFLIRKSIIPFCVSRKTITKKIDIDKESGKIIDRYSFLMFSRKLIFAPRVWCMFNTHEREELPLKKFRKY